MAIPAIAPVLTPEEVLFGVLVIVVLLELGFEGHDIAGLQEEVVLWILSVFPNLPVELSLLGSSFSLRYLGRAWSRLGL